jgi:hypothetical protein
VLKEDIQSLSLRYQGVSVKALQGKRHFEGTAGVRPFRPFDKTLGDRLYNHIDQAPDFRFFPGFLTPSANF